MSCCQDFCSLLQKPRGSLLSSGRAASVGDDLCVLPSFLGHERTLQLVLKPVLKAWPSLTDEALSGGQYHDGGRTLKAPALKEPDTVMDVLTIRSLLSRADRALHLVKIELGLPVETREGWYGVIAIFPTERVSRHTHPYGKKQQAFLPWDGGSYQHSEVYCIKMTTLRNIFGRRRIAAPTPLNSGSAVGPQRTADGRTVFVDMSAGYAFPLWARILACHGGLVLLAHALLGDSRLDLVLVALAVRLSFTSARGQPRPVPTWANGCTHLIDSITSSMEAHKQSVVEERQPVESSRMEEKSLCDEDDLSDYEK